MKKLLYISITLLVAACSSGNDLEKKKSQLADYQAQQDELKVKIAELEKEIVSSLTLNRSV
jgi:outer membrane murein-binding lipoprotein Lpp